MANQELLKEDIIRCIDKKRKTIKDIDEERYEVFTQELFDVENENYKQVGPLNEIETSYFRYAYGIEKHNINERFKRKVYNALGFNFDSKTKDVILWLVQTKVSYYLRKDREVSIRKLDNDIEVSINELELFDSSRDLLHRLGIHTLKQLASKNVRDVFKWAANMHTSPNLKMMLYDIYEVVHDMGYTFADETRVAFEIIKSNNPEELLNLSVTSLHISSKLEGDLLINALQEKKIYTVGDLTSFTVSELANLIGNRMARIAAKSIHSTNLLFADETYITRENPYFKREKENEDTDNLISLEAQKNKSLREIYEKKLKEKEELQEKLNIVNDELKKIENYLNDKGPKINI